MIIFNALALVVGVIIALFLGPLFWLFPTFRDSTWGNVVSFSIVTVVGIVTDLIGLKGRVFFLPFWLFGLIGLGVNLHTMWGWWGPALAGALVVAMIVGLLALSAVSERKEWAAAPGHLNALRENLGRGVNDQTWELLSKAYSVPTWGDPTPERCRHNLEVLAAARKAMPENPGAIELRVFDALGLAYRGGLEHTEGAKKVSIPHRLTSAMQEIFTGKGALPPDGDHKDLLEELDRPREVAATS